jgi:hypothetical protein
MAILILAGIVLFFVGGFLFLIFGEVAGNIQEIPGFIGATG